VARLEVGEQSGERLGGAFGAEGDGVTVHRLRPRADRDQQGVVVERGPAADDHPSRIGVDLAQGVLHERGAELTRDRVERMAGGVTQAERLGDRHRAVHELGLGSEQRHA
jgi:hypothetical protein